MEQETLDKYFNLIIKYVMEYGKVDIPNKDTKFAIYYKENPEESHRVEIFRKNPKIRIGIFKVDNRYHIDPPMDTYTFISLVDRLLAETPDEKVKSI